MSVQFGRWNFDGQLPAPGYIDKVSAALAPYGPDSNESYTQGGIKILYRAFYTTKESRREEQPHICTSGAVISWDGRLDNRAELITELQDAVTMNSTDIAIVAAMYEKAGATCFGKLIGDWALSIWNPSNRSLILAKDPIGTRHLYYSIDKNQVTWSSILDPLVLFAGKTFAICEEYIAGWLSYFPAAHLTPYVGIHAVPPSSSVLLQPGKHIVSKYWDFDPDKTIRYRSDTEYEEHFRTAFATAVQRSLRSDRPVLAELSGGMDSSSIVCMADTVIAQGHAECPRLDTISWYNSSWPTWDDPVYFAKVEEKRGRTGCHIDLSTQKQSEELGAQIYSTSESEFEGDHFAAAPIPNNRSSSELFKQYVAYMMSQEHRVTLSGLAGENATGAGVPTPKQELQNLLATAQFYTLSCQVNAWAAKMRQTRLTLLWEAIRGFFPLALLGVPKDARPAPWFRPDFVRRNHAALCGYPSRVKLFGPLPSFQVNVHTLDSERRLLAFYTLPSAPPREKRYPYVDRSLLEFLYAIPREQIVRIGQRRSLMRRALVGIVPNELLNRKQKAFVPQEAQEDSVIESPNLFEMHQHIVSGSIGIIDTERFVEALRKARHNEAIPIGWLRHTLTLESWLHHLTIHGVVTDPTPTTNPDYYSHHSKRSEKSLCMSLDTREHPVPAQPNSSAS